ncbi:hypothetical protein THUN1379_27890 [Paludibacterium sp. THUN1379]|uniref:glycosyltransferase family 2 protein n=1 Tax=Paludibacterium sp. THUN1379 TaxID=3112107 RepID=UPI0030921E68|nr:hypothetical protein THUN1379_27890 [Paludibacterium sp. THUN1379]
MTAISILLPSIRPELAKQRISEFAEHIHQIDYEVVLVSPFSVDLPRVVHIQENERRGVIHAMNEAYKAASGEMVVLWSDDAKIQPQAIENIVKFTKSQDGLFAAGFRKKDETGRESEQWSVYGKLYVGWLCATKKTIDAAGGLFDPVFRNYWADPDLSLRIHAMGGSVQVCQNAWIEIAQAEDVVKQANLASSFEKDTETFFAKWHPFLGRKRRCEWWEINTPIPYDFKGRVKSVLRKIPFLKKLKDACSGL